MIFQQLNYSQQFLQQFSNNENLAISFVVSEGSKSFLKPDVTSIKQEQIILWRNVTDNLHFCFPDHYLVEAEE